MDQHDSAGGTAERTHRDQPLLADRHSEDSLRRQIPHFAYLGIAGTFPAAFLLADTTGAALQMCANAVLALALTELARRLGWIRNGRPQLIAGLLVAYSALIAVGCGLAGSLLGYGELQLLVIMFGAFFFTGWARYAMAVFVPVVELGVMTAFDGLALHVAGLRMLWFVVVAHFGVRIAAILHEGLAAHRSLYEVLQAAGGEPLEPQLAARGLDAALGVVGWHAGTVAVVEGDRFVEAASTGLTVPLGDYYAAHPPLVHGTTTAAQVLRSGETLFVADAREHLPAGHPLLADGVRCLAGTPIRARGEVIGVLLAAHRAPRTFSERDRDRLTAVAEQLGLALSNARAWRQEAEVTEGLRALNRRKDEFLAAVSHELRTPATTIELAARTLRKAGDRLSPQERDAITLSMLRRSRDLREMIESLLDVALSESGDNRAVMAPLDWQFCLTRWTGELAQQHERRIELDLPDETVVAMADAAKMERVLSALVSNAVKFSPDDTPVRVRLDVDGPWLRLSVRDEGMGILPDDLERIFHRFLQLDGSETRTVGGLGIGLTLVRQFVALHGGRVDVDSTPGAGSTFTVSVPRQRAAQASRILTSRATPDVVAQRAVQPARD